jgi:amino acid transporter
VPYAAALDGYFFKPFARLHAGGFPSLALLVIGGLSITASFLDLGWVIDALVASRIVIQFIPQVVALDYLRRRRKDVARPFRMWLYPLPSLLALLGFSYIFVTQEPKIILFGLGVLGTGVLAFILWRRSLRA